MAKTKPSPTDGPDFLFSLRFRLNLPGHGGTVTIRAWDMPRWNDDGTPCKRYPNENRFGHHYIDAEMSWRPDGAKRAEVVFPRGATWCGVASGACSDGIEARELVTSLFTIRPGDTDSEYFENYTPEQLAWVEQWAETLGMERMDRYCDPETGDVRRPKRR